METRIAPEELTFDKVVGQGISGIVWKATWKSQVVAVKRFNEDSLAFSFEEFTSETALMSVLRHQNIVHCIGSCAEPENLYIVSELFEKGCVSDIVEDKSYNLTTQMALHLAYGAACGMKYLHMLGLIHRDLKNGNLLVSDNWTAKVADFGLSRMTDNKMTRGVGTPIYTAPETLRGNEYSQKADVYSFAFVMWELFTREVPFGDIPPFEAVLRASEQNLRPPIPPNCVVEGLISSCWDKDPDSRPTFAEIVNVLRELVALVGPPSELSQSGYAEEDETEDIQYNYSQANQIVQRTLRPTIKDRGRASSYLITETTSANPADGTQVLGRPKRDRNAEKVAREDRKRKRTDSSGEKGSRVRLGKKESRGSKPELTSVFSDMRIQAETLEVESRATPPPQRFEAAQAPPGTPPIQHIPTSAEPKRTLSSTQPSKRFFFPLFQLTRCQSNYKNVDIARNPLLGAL